MNVVCLCPTYGRPNVVANAAACFLTQDYPADQRKLLILDDANQIQPQWNVEGVSVITSAERYSSLPAKYNVMIDIMSDWADAVCVWDDDDIYLPWHVRTHVEAMTGKHSGRQRLWSHPTNVYSTYTGRPMIEAAAGRFHGSLAVQMSLLQLMGGWVGVMPPHHPKRADFDQRMIAACASFDERGNPVLPHGPGYVYRWGDSGAVHCSGLMKTPDNEDWYDNMRISEPRAGGPLKPKFDARTKQLMRELVPASLPNPADEVFDD